MYDLIKSKRDWLQIYHNMSKVFECIVGYLIFFFMIPLIMRMICITFTFEVIHWNQDWTHVKWLRISGLHPRSCQEPPIFKIVIFKWVGNSELQCSAGASGDAALPVYIWKHCSRLVEVVVKNWGELKRAAWLET